MMKKAYRCSDLIQTEAQFHLYPENKVHGAKMGPIWGQQDPDGPHIGPMNFAIWVEHRSAKYLVQLKDYLRVENKMYISAKLIISSKEYVSVFLHFKSMG